MSRVFVESFFPATSHCLKATTTTAAVVFEHVFPPSVAIKCPEVVWLNDSYQQDGNFHFYSIRNPCLLCQTIIGILIGWGGAAALHHFRYCNSRISAKSKRQREGTAIEAANSQNYKQQQQQRQSLQMWFLAFFMFGAMNAVALPLHCLTTTTTAAALSSSSSSWRIIVQNWLWILDHYCTGSSSAALVTVCRRSRPNNNNNTTTTSMGLLQEWYLWNAVGFLCMVILHIYDDHNYNNMASLPLELWYILPTAVAAHYVSRMYGIRLFFGHNNNTYSTNTKTTRIVASILVTSILWIVGGILLDAPICEFLSSSQANDYHGYIADAFRAPTQVFSGCNLAFGSLLYDQLQQQSQQLQQQKQMMIKEEKEA